MWPAKLKITAIPPFTEQVCQPLGYRENIYSPQSQSDETNICLRPTTLTWTPSPLTYTLLFSSEKVSEISQAQCTLSSKGVLVTPSVAVLKKDAQESHPRS